MWRTEVKTTACSGDSLWGPGELSEKREGWLELWRPLLAPLVMGLGRPSPSLPKMPARIGCK